MLINFPKGHQNYTNFLVAFLFLNVLLFGFNLIPVFSKASLINNTSNIKSNYTIKKQLDTLDFGNNFGLKNLNISPQIKNLSVAIDSQIEKKVIEKKAIEKEQFDQATIRTETAFVPSQNPTEPIVISSTPQVFIPPSDPIISKKNKISGHTLTINKLGMLDVPMLFGSVYNLNDIDAKLVNSPVIENQAAAGICGNLGNAFIYGHSEAPNNFTIGNATEIFSSLTSLTNGDEIRVNFNGENICKYRVNNWDKTVTNSNGDVTMTEFNRVMKYPEMNNEPSLTIQTCQKGSTTVRLLLRAYKVT